LLGLFFDPEDVGDKFLRNVGHSELHVIKAQNTSLLTEASFINTINRVKSVREMRYISREAASEVSNNLSFRRTSVFTESSTKENRKNGEHSAYLHCKILVSVYFRSLVDTYIIYLFMHLFFVYLAFSFSDNV
jgi:hypothetical protein